MGDICSDYQAGTQSRPPGARAADLAMADVMIEIGTAARIPLSVEARATALQVFSVTIGSFVHRRGPAAWSGTAREFVLRRVRRIAEEAGNLAAMDHSSEILARHMERAADIIICSTRSAESRLATSTA